MLAAENISVAFGRRQVLHGVDLAVAPGAITAVIGPNGSGKTTLVKAISGEVAHSGSVTLNGADVKSLKPWQVATRRAVLPQATTLSFPFTVREVVALGLVAGGVGSGADRPEQALARVDLDGFAGRFYQDLSGGEQQRVQMARVLCQLWEPVADGAPRYLLLDEPISSLDIRHQLVIMDIARDFARAGGGVLAILHDLNLAAMYADAVLVMREGRTHAFGPPAAVLADDLLLAVFGCALRVNSPPATPFVLPQSASAVTPR
jgi:iron complex transport system ATP-binding protein